MSDQNSQPSFRTIIIAVVIFIAALGLLCMFGSILKLAGDVLLYVPSQLGLVRRVVPDEVHTIDLRTASPALLEITESGQYTVFTVDYDLLMANTQVKKGSSSWLSVKSHATGEAIKLLSVERGMRPYDTPLAEGRPIFAFKIDAPGVYELGYSTRYTFISIVPDYTTGKEPVIVLAYILQIAILATPLGIVFYWRYQRQRARIKNIEGSQAQRRAQGETFWKSEIQARKEKTQGKQ